MAEHPKPRGCLASLSHAIETGMNSFFSRLGWIVANNPWKTLAIALVVCLIGMGGFSVLEEESRGDKLWVPTGTRSQEDYATYLSYFPGEGRENLVIIVPSAGDNVLTKDYLIKSLEYFQDLSDITITYETVVKSTATHTVVFNLPAKKFSLSLVGQEYSFADLCVSSTDYIGTPCEVESILGKWEYDLDTLSAADASSIVETVNNGSTVNELENVLGGMELADDGTVASAEALRLMLLLKNTQTVENGEYVDPIPDAWELEFIDEAQQCVDGLECFVEAARSLDDEFSGAIQGDIALISGSYLIILVYATINLSGRPLLKSRVMLSIGALITVGLSIAVSIGISSYLGFFYTPLHTVLPFVLLGLGVDDSFVICNAFGRTDPRKPINERISESLGHSGVSITVTSITDFVAFMISSTTALPALESFCVYSAFGVLALYILQSTVFVAFVVFDARRQEAGRLDIVPCCKTKHMDRRPSAIGRAAVPPGEAWDPKKGEQGYLERFVSEIFAPLLTYKIVKAFFIVVFAIIVGFSLYGATRLEVKDTGESFIPDGSYLLDTNEAVEKYFGGVGAGVEIVTTDIDYFASQGDLADVASQLSGLESKSPYIQDPFTSGTFFSWFDDLVSYAEAEGNVELVESGAYTIFGDKDEFYATLGAFLNSSDGARYETSVVMDGSTVITAAAIQSEYSGEINGEADEQVDALVDMRDLVDGFPFEAFPWSESYLTWETYRVIYLELYQGLGLCLGAVLILTLILIAHPCTALLVFFCVTITIVDVLGIMYYWGLAIDTVAVIQLVLAVGLSVDYSAHVGHSFMLKAGTRDERMVQALSDIGVAVIHGGVSTFLAVVLLSLSSSYVFRVLFKQFFSTAVMGLAHGLILLPILLSLIGPDSYLSANAPSKAADSTVTAVPEATVVTGAASGNGTGNGKENGSKVVISGGLA